MDELDKALAKRGRTKRADDAALDELYEVIRRMLQTGGHGIQAEISRRTGYSRQHLDRIKRGKTSGAVEQ